MSKENQKTTSDFDALDPRERVARPFRPRKVEAKMLAASLNAFFGLLGLRLRRWCYAFAELYVQQGRKVCFAKRKLEKREKSVKRSD